MAENNWVLQDGRVILVEFDAAAVATNWGWFGNRSSGEGLEFAAPESAWTEHAWLRGGQYIMAGGASAFFGILKRWTGATWTKAKMQTYLGGSWQSKPLKVWDAGSWKEIDTTGI
jgi:hypothetical protein